MSEWFQIEPAWRDRLQAAGLHRLGDWLALGEHFRHGRPDASRPTPGPPGQVVSRHADRLTVRLELPDPSGGPACTLFAKIHFGTSAKRIACDLLHARRPDGPTIVERRWLGRLADAGVDAMAPVAWGQRRRFGLPGDGVLVVQAVPPPHDLARCLADRPELADDPGLWAAVGRLIGALGRLRLFWPDLTAKHLFPQRQADGWRIFLIDVERMTPCRRTPPARQQWDVLAASLERPPSIQAAAALLEGVGRGAGRSPTRPEALLEAAHARLAHAPRPPDDDWRRSEPQMVRRGPLTIHPAYLDALARMGLDDLDAIFRYESGRSLTKPGLPAHRRRDRVELPDGRTIYLKRYQPDKWQRLTRALRRGVRPSEAADEWHALWRLARGGAIVPEPVLFGQSGWAWAADRSCIGLAALPGQSLEKWLPAHGPGLTLAQKRPMLEALGDLVGRLHRLGMVHRDLYLSHVFVSFNADSRPVFHLIDLARVFRPVRWRRHRWRVKDLAQLHYSSSGCGVSRADRLRFLRRYLRAMAGDGEDGSAWKSLARAVDRKASSIARRAARRARPRI